MRKVTCEQFFQLASSQRLLCFVNYDQVGMSHAARLVDCRREREILLKVRLGFSDDGARAILRGYNGN